jgi:creatinine amidohydrolase
MSRLAQMNWVDVERKLSGNDLCLIPVGAVEVYGPHMPLGTDGIVAEALAQTVADRLDALVTPLIPVGYSADLLSFPGTLSVPTAAVKQYCAGVAESLFLAGARRILFVNGHLGNVGPIDEVCQDLSRPNGQRRLAQVDVWRFIQPLSDGLLRSTEWKFGHAGEAMTAVMLHLHPDWVLMQRAERAAPTRPADQLGLSRPFSYREFAPMGTLGDATLATAEAGKELFERMVTATVEFVTGREFAIGDVA